MIKNTLVRSFKFQKDFHYWALPLSVYGISVGTEKYFCITFLCFQFLYWKHIMYPHYENVDKMLTNEAVFNLLGIEGESKKVHTKEKVEEE